MLLQTETPALMNAGTGEQRHYSVALGTMDPGPEPAPTQEPRLHGETERPGRVEAHYIPGSILRVATQREVRVRTGVGGPAVLQIKRLDPESDGP